MQRILELENVSLVYSPGEQAVDALSGIDLSVEEGEFVCILGPSGCGKSTLLNIIAGLLRPTAGIVKMLGEPISGPDRRRGMIFQAPALYPWLNTRGNVAFGLKMRGVDKRKISEEVEKYLQLVDLTEFADSKIYELSGGMKQRVQLARVLINQPDVVLMDEPFGALDALTRSGMQDLIRGIWMKNKNSVLLVTHDVDEALCLATRIIVMTNRPGTITGEFRTDFTARIAAGEDDCQYTEAYIGLKKELMHIICAR